MNSQYFGRSFLIFLKILLFKWFNISLSINMRIVNIELGGIDTRDYPDFVDAFITYAEWEDGTPLTDDELSDLNDDSSFVYNEVIDYLF